MNDENDIITTDNPLTSAQQESLISLVDVLIPPAEDGRLPGVAELDLISYIKAQAPEFIPALKEALDGISEEFSALTRVERYPLVEAFSQHHADLFDTLMFHVLACYYQDDRVLTGIGLAPGPPFPRGNTLVSGDLSLLDAVAKRTGLYRP